MWGLQYFSQPDSKKKHENKNRRVRKKSPLFVGEVERVTSFDELLIFPAYGCQLWIPNQHDLGNGLVPSDNNQPNIWAIVGQHQQPWLGYWRITLQWRHNGCDSVSNHRPHDCLLNRLFRRRSKKTSKLRVTGLSAGNSPGNGEFPAQMASNAENVFIWWRHHGYWRINQPQHRIA